MYPVKMSDRRKCYGNTNLKIIIVFFILLVVPNLIPLLNKMLMKGTLPKIRTFSTDFSDPNGSYWGMKNTLKSRVRLQRKIISRNFLTKLHKRKVGTGEIEYAAKKNVFGEDASNANRTKEVEKEVVRILKLRLRTADKKIKELEHIWKKDNEVRKNVFVEEGWRWCARGLENSSGSMKKNGL